MRLFPTLSAPIRTARVAVAAVALLAAANVVEAQTATASPTSEPTPASSPIAQPHAQVPGYYRMALGDDVVTALYDGYIDLPAKTLLGLSAQSIQGLLARMFVSSTSGMQTAVNGYLIDTGSQRILVDTGSGTCFGPTMGGLAGNLRAAGYQPERIDAVLLTHLHPDHACGLLTPQGQPAYPNAQVYVAAPEAGVLAERGRRGIQAEGHAAVLQDGARRRGAVCRGRQAEAVQAGRRGAAGRALGHCRWPYTGA